MHPEALTETGEYLFPRLGRFKDFYLVGGTALALQIGHRRSIDFDMFTKEQLPDTSRELKIPCIVGLGGMIKILRDGDEVEADANEGVVRVIKKNSPRE